MGKTWQLSMKAHTLDQKLEQVDLKETRRDKGQSLVKTVSVSERLYNEFKLKNKLQTVHKSTVIVDDRLCQLEEQQTKNENLCITIHLKGGNKKSGSFGQLNGALDEDFLRAIQEEYATRYLELMGIEPTQHNKMQLLKRKPLTSCEMTPSWNSSGWLADIIQIYPNKSKKKTFENSREKLLQHKQELRKQQDEQQLKNKYSDEEFAGEIRNKMRTSLESKRQNFIQSEEILQNEQKPKRNFDQNLELSYWKEKFLYPFALDPAPLRLDPSMKQKPEELLAEKKRQKLMADEGIMATQKYQFPVSQIKKLQEFLHEIQQPIVMTLEQIKQDMNSYAKNFPIKEIPHITEAKEIIDFVHNYQGPKPSQQQTNQKPQKGHQKNFVDLETKKSNTALIQGLPTLEEATIQIAQREIQELSTSKLIGLIAHLAYWNVFGHFNSLPLDLYHMNQMFISISTICTQLDLKYQGKKFYHVFLMPMLLLAIRIEVEVIFKNSYPNFFRVEVHEKIAMKLINDLITKLIDPNIFYSRFSFFESGRDAINLKQLKAKAGQAQSTQNRFYRRSALVEQLFPNPSEGKVRALFGTGVQSIMAKTSNILQTQKKESKDTNILPTVRESYDFQQSAKSMRKHLNTANHSGRPKLLNNRAFSQKLLATNDAPIKSTINRSLSKEDNPYLDGILVDQAKDEDKVLQLVNKVQMFQIAVQKINNLCKQRNEEPVFKMAKGGQFQKNGNFSKYFEN